MPTPEPTSCRAAEALRIYAETPLSNGDAILLLDDTVCLELAGLADHWDDLLRRNTAKILRDTASSVVVAIARPGAELLPRDFQLWRDLHAALRDTDVELHPVRALPAA